MISKQEYIVYNSQGFFVFITTDKYEAISLAKKFNNDYQTDTYKIAKKECF